MVDFERLAGKLLVAEVHPDLIVRRLPGLALFALALAGIDLDVIGGQSLPAIDLHGNRRGFHDAVFGHSAFQIQVAVGKDHLVADRAQGLVGDLHQRDAGVEIAHERQRHHVARGHVLGEDSAQLVVDQRAYDKGLALARHGQRLHGQLGGQGHIRSQLVHTPAVQHVIGDLTLRAEIVRHCVYGRLQKAPVGALDGDIGIIADALVEVLYVFHDGLRFGLRLLIGRLRLAVAGYDDHIAVDHGFSREGIAVPVQPLQEDAAVQLRRLRKLSHRRPGLNVQHRDFLAVRGETDGIVFGLNLFRHHFHPVALLLGKDVRGNQHLAHHQNDQKQRYGALFQSNFSHRRIPPVVGTCLHHYDELLRRQTASGTCKHTDLFIHPSGAALRRIGNEFLLI